MLDFAGTGPEEVLLVGAIPGSSAMGVGLTPALQAAVAPAAAEVLRELERLGCPAAPRAGAIPAAPWWEAPASPVVH